jgi:hypothetical protein
MLAIHGILRTYSGFTLRCENVTSVKTKLLIKNLKFKTIFTLILHKNNF